MLSCKNLCKGMAAALLLSASTSLYAVSTTYNYLITGDVELGDEIDANAFGLTAGETITAYGTFTADSSLFSGSGGTVSFESGTGNTMALNLNGTLLYASDDSSYAVGGPVGPTLTFSTSGQLFDFDYLKTSTPTFNSSFLFFDDFNSSSMLGKWRANAVVTAVPEAETYAMMLAGLGLLGCVGVARRKSLKTAA